MQLFSLRHLRRTAQIAQPWAGSSVMTAESEQPARPGRQKEEPETDKATVPVQANTSSRTETPCRKSFPLLRFLQQVNLEILWPPFKTKEKLKIIRWNSDTNYSRLCRSWFVWLFFFFLWNTKEILQNVVVQTTLGPIHFHCMDQNTDFLFSYIHKVIHFWNDMKVSKLWQHFHFLHELSL